MPMSAHLLVCPPYPDIQPDCTYARTQPCTPITPCALTQLTDVMLKQCYLPTDCTEKEYGPHPAQNTTNTLILKTAIHLQLRFNTNLE